MMSKLYNPFDAFLFDAKTCFLSGEPLQSMDEELQVFPTWLMQRYELAEKPFKMLDESIKTYKQLKVPCSASVAETINMLEEKIQGAFTQGYQAVKELDQLELFQWISKLVYGVVFNEIQAGVRQHQMTGEPLNFSQVLSHKFKNLHLMMQSLISPMQFDGTLPFTILVFPVDNPPEMFNYRDEINTLVFSMRMNDFGIVACLQDNGTNKIYHQDVLSLVEDELHNPLHPLQFEEICARFFYSSYLFNRLPEYTVLQTPSTTYIEAMSLADMSMKPMFDHWQAKTYGQVLENFWKPWDMTLFEIIKDPENPISFLLDESGKFRPAADVFLDKR